MANGYRPAPLDTRDIELDEKMGELVELLAKNTHSVWAKEKINRGWTYGVSEVSKFNRSFIRLVIKTTTALFICSQLIIWCTV